MLHHTHKLADTESEEDTYVLLCMDSLLIYDNTDCFSLNIEEISFPLAPRILEVEQNMELQAGSITNIMTDLNKANYDWNYKLVEGINLIHYRNMIYMLKTLQKLFFKWYNYCLQHPGGNRLAHTLTNICRWAGIFGQEGKIFRTF